MHLFHPLPCSTHSSKPHAAERDINQLGFQHLQQSQNFLLAAGPALQSVTTLDLELAGTFRLDYKLEEPETRLELEKEMGTLLGPLPKLCPLVRTLKVTGDVGAPLLAAFGALCEHLTCLDAANLDPSTAERLHELLPRVTVTHLRLYDRDYQCIRRITALLPAISTCRTLTTLDIPDHELTEQVCRALPPSIQELHVGNGCGSWNMGGVVPRGFHLPSLRVVTGPGYFPLCKLANLLRAAPNLQYIEMCDVMVPCSGKQIPDLVLLHARISAGLVVKNTHEDSPHPEGVMLQLMDSPDLSETRYQPSVIMDFMQRLPVFELFRNVSLGKVEPSQLASLARVFPRMQMLYVSGVTQSSKLYSLAVLSLQTLELRVEWTRLTALELGMLCFHIPSLQHLYVSAVGHSQDSLVADCDGIMQVLSAWGKTVGVHAQ